jgi:glucosylceramidase
MTGGSAYLINRLPAPDRAAILKELFTADSNNIGISYLRVSIGASDLSSSVFSYDDNGTPAQPDTTLQYFSLSSDEFDLVPLLKQIVALNPSIKILGSPWSAPLWMKTNNSSIGGTLQPQYYDVYARYLVKYIQAMKAEGIPIDAITPQNEPMNPNNNPSMALTAGQEAAFIKNNLGPACKTAGITTKIIVFDHNCGNPEYPLAVLSDPDVLKYSDGAAFHLYGGDISALSQILNAYPSKNVYFTEQWVGGPSNFGGDLGWAVKNLIVGASRNWSRNVLEWNLASDPNYQPHTAGGCGNCLGALTIGSSITRNVSYYIIAHAAKFVRPGSVRVDTNIPGTLQNVAFVRPDGRKVLIVLNDSNASQTFNIQSNGKMVTTTLDGGAVGTYVW